MHYSTTELKNVHVGTYIEGYIMYLQMQHVLPEGGKESCDLRFFSRQRLEELRLRPARVVHFLLIYFQAFSLDFQQHAIFVALALSYLCPDMLFPNN